MLARLSNFPLSPPTQESRTRIRQVFVRHNDGTVAIDGHPFSVATLKESLRVKVGVPQELQVLTFEGRVLDDERPISSYGICHGATLHLAQRGRGGARGAPCLTQDPDATTSHSPFPV